MTQLSVSANIFIGKVMRDVTDPEETKAWAELALLAVVR